MKKKILVIEDEQTLVKALMKMLDHEYDVVSAIDGESGLEKVQSLNPDLVLLDLILPKMNGFDVLQRIKNNEKTKNIPVIVLTNLSDVADKVKNLGGNDCLAKADYSMEDIRKKIKEKLV